MPVLLSAASESIRLPPVADNKLPRYRELVERPPEWLS
jgi:hypothetical protein